MKCNLAESEKYDFKTREMYDELKGKLLTKTAEFVAVK